MIRGPCDDIKISFNFNCKTPAFVWPRDNIFNTLGPYKYYTKYIFDHP